MRIFLIGFMGSGKSTLGKKLAHKLQYDFVDLDHEVEKKIGTSISSYFSAQGEDAFRQTESDVLKMYPYSSNCIIATGGGTPCYADNMEWMNSNGITLYIELPPAALVSRLEKGKEKRPLLKNLNGQQMLMFIENKLAERESFYKRAFLSIDGIDLTTDQIRTQVFRIF